MKAIVVHKYGGPEELKFEEYRDPVPGADEVVVRTAATSVNPIDIMRRSGVAKDFAPIEFPGIVGMDLSGTVVELGSAVKEFSAGDQVFGMADQTYAELCAVGASNLVKIPEGGESETAWCVSFRLGSAEECGQISRRESGASVCATGREDSKAHGGSRERGPPDNSHQQKVAAQGCRPSSCSGGEGQGRQAPACYRLAPLLVKQGHEPSDAALIGYSKRCFP